MGGRSRPRAANHPPLLPVSPRAFIQTSGSAGSLMSEVSATAFVVERPSGLRRFAHVLETPLARPASETLAVIALCPLLLVVALWNGFPLIFYDTGAYMLQSFGDKFVPERSPVFSLYILFAGGGISLWLV